MLKTYKARLKNDRLEWLGERPAPSELAREVDVSFLNADGVAPGEKSSARAVAALRELAEMGGLSHIIPDPVAWQREMRKDRPLPGREE